MNRFNIKRFETTVTIPANRDTFDSPVVTELGGKLKGITIDAPGLTGTSFVLSILGQRGEILFTKSSIVENVITHLNSMSIGGTEYPMDVPISINDTNVVRIKSTGTPDATVELEFSNAGAIVDGETVTIGDETYTFREDLTGGGNVSYEVLIEDDIHATGTITSDETNPADGGNVVIDDQTYVFKTALSAGPEVPNEILIGVDADTTLNNLKAAINGEAGEGTLYSTGTGQPSSGVTASEVVAHVITLTHPDGGTGGNAVIFTKTATHISISGSGTLTGGAWSGDLTLENLADAINGEDGGGEEGTKYGEGTVAHTQVEAGSVTSHVLELTALESVESGEDVPVETDAAELSFSAETLEDGGEADERIFYVDLLIDRG